MGRDKRQKSIEKKQRKAAAAKDLEVKQQILNVAQSELNVLSLLNFKSFKTTSGRQLSVESCRGDSLSTELQQSCFRLFEANMKEQYEASIWGYDPIAKKHEMFHTDSRYLVVTDNDSSGSNALAFVHYRFLLEEDMRLTIYIYEIQVCEELQRSGVGKRLMILLEILCRKFEFQQLMLTVFDLNTKAMQFYKQKLAYVIHENSPLPEEEVGYQILCKVL